MYKRLRREGFGGRNLSAAALIVQRRKLDMQIMQRRKHVVAEAHQPKAVQQVDEDKGEDRLGGDSFAHCAAVEVL